MIVWSNKNVFNVSKMRENILIYINNVTPYLNMPHQDIVVVGVSNDLNDFSSPAKCDILKC